MRTTHPEVRRHRTRARGLAGLATAAVLLSLAPATTEAHADPAVVATAGSTAGSIVYIRANNVWIARANGSGARRLTSSGTAAAPFRYPSEDDAGHVVALRGKVLYRMDQRGVQLQHFTVPLPGLGVDFASVSPDGSKVAYSWLIGQTDCSFSPCHTFFEHTLAFTSATRSKSVPASTRPDNVSWASWVTNSRTVLGWDSDVRYNDISSGVAKDWYQDCDNTRAACTDDPNEVFVQYFPAVSRQGNRYASVVADENYAGTEDRHTFLNILSTSNFQTGNPPALPTTRCIIDGLPTHAYYPTSSEVTIQTPSWSPDGRSLVAAFQNTSKQWAVFRIDIGASVGDCGSYAATKIVAGGSQPRWSPATLKAVTTTRVSVSSAAPVRRHTLAVTARVSSSSATGTVRFRDGSRTLRTVRLSHGVATYRTASLATGAHRLSAVYNGNSSHSGSTSAGVRIVVQPKAPPHTWHFKAVPEKGLLSRTAAANRAVDVRVAGVAGVPARAKGVLLALGVANGTAKTRVYVCPRPGSGRGIPRHCGSVVAPAHRGVTAYLMVAVGAKYDARLLSTRGHARLRVYVLGYYR